QPRQVRRARAPPVYGPRDPETGVLDGEPVLPHELPHDLVQASVLPAAKGLQQCWPGRGRCLEEGEVGLGAADISCQDHTLAPPKAGRDACALSQRPNAKLNAQPNLAVPAAQPECAPQSPLLHPSG